MRGDVTMYRHLSLSGRRQAIIRTNVIILLIGPLATNFSEILIEVLIFSLKKMRLKVLSAKWWPSCLGLNVLNKWSACIPSWLWPLLLKVRSNMRGRTRAGAGGKLASTQIITCVHTCAVAEREQKPLRKKWVQHPIYRARFETARSKPSLSSRNGRSARVRSAYVWTYPR